MLKYEKNLFKLFGICFFIAAVSSCSSDIDDIEESPGLNENKVEINQGSFKRSLSDAISIASKYGRFKSSSSRGHELRVDETSVIPIVSTKTRNSSDTLIYAVNYSDNMGYLLISANKATEPIIAIIENGSYTENDKEHSGGFSYFLDNALDYVERAIPIHDSIPSKLIPGDGDEFVMVVYDDTIKTVSMKKPRVEVNYGQGWPENIYCPNKVAGYGPIAVTQAMTYLKPNVNVELTFEGKPFDNLVINWNELLTHKQSMNVENPDINEINDHVSKCNQSLSVHQKLGALVRQIGVWSKAAYNESSTSTYSDDIFAVSNRLFSECYRYFVNSDKFYEHLKTTGIAIMDGHAIEGGHIWIADGVGTIDYHITRYHIYNPRTHEYEYSEIINQQSKYVHCNWGWAGFDNGYFLDGVFNTKKGYDAISSVQTRYDFYMGVCGYVYKP